MVPHFPNTICCATRQPRLILLRCDWAITYMKSKRMTKTIEDRSSTRRASQHWPRLGFCYKSPVANAMTLSQTSHLHVLKGHALFIWGGKWDSTEFLNCESLSCTGLRKVCNHSTPVHPSILKTKTRTQKTPQDIFLSTQTLR